MNRCKELRLRQKGYKKYLWCNSDKEVITFDTCKKCSKQNLAKNKSIKRVSKNKERTESSTYEIVFRRDKGACRLCGTTKDLQLHHIEGRSKKLTNDINNCIILCKTCHLEKVHGNQKYYKPILKQMLKEIDNDKGRDERIPKN